MGDHRQATEDRPPAGYLPAELTSFVGRRAELHSIVASVAGARLVTLAGPGGAGKSRLAARAAARLRDGAGQAGKGAGYPDGVWWVDLSPEKDPAAVPARVAEAVRTLLTSGVDEVPSLARQLADRRLLVILDNCEHLLAAVNEVVCALLRGCRGVRVLATSREPVGAPGEVVWKVPPLDSHDAVALFADRGGWRTDRTAGHDGAVRRICARLDRIPLALELAAAWTSTLSPEEIAAALDDRFGLLVTGAQSAPSRQRTLAASMAWSHDLLDNADRRLFRRLAAFQAGFTHGAAQAVCAFGGLDRAAVLTGLRRLIDKSLLVAEPSGGTTRYRMLESVREYAATRLAEAAEATPVLAARLIGAADRARAGTEYPRSTSDDDVRGRLGTGAITEGQAMNLDQAVAYARRARGARPRLASGWAGLTSTEREVVRLAVEGLTNPEIAKRLFVTRSTVKTHLAHVYAQLGVANRTELASASARAAPTTS